MHVVTAKGREYAWHQKHRGTSFAGPRTKLPWPPYHLNGEPDPTFWEAYARLEDSTANPCAPPAPGTFRALVQAYLKSPEFEEKSDRGTKREYRRNAHAIAEMWGDLRVDGLEPKHAVELRDSRRDTPGSANAILRVLSVLISWSIVRGYRADNPCAHVPKLRLGDGHAAWSWEQISFFREHAVPELWRIAAIALYTGQRQADVLKMRWSDIKDGRIQVVQQKSGRRRTTVWVPVHRDLQRILDQMPRRSLLLVTTKRGKPFTPDGFRAVLADQMACLDLLGNECDGLTFHRLRKSSVYFLLEAGCTTGEVSAITGQSLQTVERYARMMDRGSMAASAMLKWENKTKLDDAAA